MAYKPEVQAEMLIDAARHLRAVSGRFDWGSYGNRDLLASIESIIDTATNMAQLPPE